MSRLGPHRSDIRGLFRFYLHEQDAVRTWGAVLDPLDPGAFWRQVALAIVHCGAQLVVVCASIACCRDWLHASDHQRYDREDGTLRCQLCSS